MKPTEEQVQQAALVKSGKNVKVIAGAGCGKSSTLRHVAKQVPARNVLVLTFNKANAEETQDHPDRPFNLFACTVHSLAYRAVITSELKKKLNNWLDYNDLDKDTILSCVWELHVPPADEQRTLALFRRTIIDCINQFCQSNKADIAEFAFRYLEYKLITKAETKLVVTPEVILRLATVTSKYWDDLRSHPTVKINPNIYLKMFQLGGHKITEVWDVKSKRYVGVQVLALDEAQDTNPVTEAIFANQTHLQRLIVGDPNQQLYRWRGAGDTMNQFNDFATGYLSTSFRFNEEIARMANIVLERNNTDLRVIGASTKTELTTKAILCRTNATVLTTFFQMIAGGLTEKVRISTDVKGTFAKMYHLEACWFNNVPRYPVSELSSITDKATMMEALDHSDELCRLNELSMMLRDACGGLTKAKAMIDEHTAKLEDKPALTISTLHGSKGLEWDEVVIADDFINMNSDVCDGETAIAEMWDDQDMRCLLYVGITRARVKCTLPEYLRPDFY